VTVLIEQCAEDAEEVVQAWLSPLGRTGTKRVANDPLPFRLVRRVTGHEDVDLSLDMPVVSVHTFALAADLPAAKNEARLTHQRMMRLAHHADDITLSDGRLANVDYLEINESPIWEDYGDDLIVRKVGRYVLGLSYVAAPDDGS
jgi:hypothetical protein